jgi:hypothetical protein
MRYIENDEAGNLWRGNGICQYSRVYFRYGLEVMVNIDTGNPEIHD